MPSGEVPCTNASLAAASCSAVDCSATTAPKSSLRDSLANVRKQPMRQRTLLVVRVGQRARIGGGTDGSARIGSAILYSRACRNSVETLKPMGHCSIANGSAATAWLARRSVETAGHVDLSNEPIRSWDRGYDKT